MKQYLNGAIKYYGVLHEHRQYTNICTVYYITLYNCMLRGGEMHPNT